MNIKELSNKEKYLIFIYLILQIRVKEIFSFEILDTILTDMRSKYISILNETFNK